MGNDLLYDIKYASNKESVRIVLSMSLNNWGLPIFAEYAGSRSFRAARGTGCSGSRSEMVSRIQDPEVFPSEHH